MCIALVYAWAGCSFYGLFLELPHYYRTSLMRQRVINRVPTLLENSWKFDHPGKSLGLLKVL